MRGITLITFAFTVLIQSGCTSTYNHANLQVPETKLSQEKTVLISVPKNGRFSDEHYINSGSQTAAALEYAVRPYAVSVDVTMDCLGSSCLTATNSKKYGYYMEPLILHWEDRATEWSGRLDRIKIRIKIYDMETQEQLSNWEVDASSRFMTFGGDHPQDLLATPFATYVASLYQ